MKKDEIKAFVARQSELAERNEAAYQATGIQRYHRAAKNAELLVSLGEQALSSAEDHDMRISLEGRLSDFSRRAEIALTYNDEGRIKALLQDLASFRR